MTIGEIKIQALKLMFANANRDIQVRDLPQLATDINYADYLSAMNGAIDRCLSDIELKGVLENERFEITDENALARGTNYHIDELCEKIEQGLINAIKVPYIMVDLRSIQNPKCKDIVQVVLDKGAYYESVSDFRREGKYIVLPITETMKSHLEKAMLNRNREGEPLGYYDFIDGYVLLYKPLIERKFWADNEEIMISAGNPLPDYIATAIPYYIKSDLFRVDEPEEASEARNFYEAVMAQIGGGNQGYQGVVSTVYDGSLL